MKFINCTDVDSFDKIYKFLSHYNIKVEVVNKDKYGFSRTLEFEHKGVTYQILWFNNESSLKIGTHPRVAFIKFKYISFDNTFPVVGGNENLVFSWELKAVKFFESPYLYSDFRLPL